MLHSLLKAQNYASKFRYTGDLEFSRSHTHTTGLDSLKNQLFLDELEISNEVTPELSEKLSEVYDRLNISRSSISSFVYPSAEYNAACYMGAEEECVLRFSSSLIEMLTSEEFQFVAGHELGHFLFQHNTANVPDWYAESPEHYLLQKSKELSADRIGLIACLSIDVAIKAMLKTLSGLDDRHLRFDIAAFIHQLRKTTSSNRNPRSTHPTSLMRCRALLWFDMSLDSGAQNPNPDRDSLRKLDSRIKLEMERHEDATILESIEEAKEDVKLWFHLLKIVEQGSFSQNEQLRFSDRFGEETLRKSKDMLSGLTTTEATSDIESKHEEAKRKLEGMIPYSYPVAINDIKDEAS